MNRAVTEGTGLLVVLVEMSLEVPQRFEKSSRCFLALYTLKKANETSQQKCITVSNFFSDLSCSGC